MTSAARSIPTLPTANGPVSSGMPRTLATAVERPVRLGPTTAPSVVAQTTVERARARVSAGARSVAAYRAPLLAAVVAPSIAAPTSSSGMEDTTPARTATRAPEAPIR